MLSSAELGRDTGWTSSSDMAGKSRQRYASISSLALAAHDRQDWIADRVFKKVSKGVACAVDVTGS